MEFKELYVPEGIVRQIDHEESLADIRVDLKNGDNLYSNVNLDVLYEDALEEMEKTMGSVPGFMKFLPKQVFIHNWSSWKMVEEINMDRARYLLNTDEIPEKMSGQTWDRHGHI